MSRTKAKRARVHCEKRERVEVISAVLVQGADQPESQ
jgi:hypothetical protein